MSAPYGKYINAGFAQLGVAIEKLCTLTLAQCSSVRHFGEELELARLQSESIDVGTKLSDAFLICRFIDGLGPKYTSWRISFDATKDLLPEYDDDGNVTREAVTFRKTVESAACAEYIMACCAEQRAERERNNNNNSYMSNTRGGNGGSSNSNGSNKRRRVRR